MSQESSGIRDADAARFSAFLDWNIDCGEGRAVAPSMLRWVRVIWRSVSRRSGVSPAGAVVGMDIAGRGDDLPSRDTSVSRLRRGLDLHQALSDEPNRRVIGRREASRFAGVRSHALRHRPASSPLCCGQI